MVIAKILGFTTKIKAIVIKAKIDNLDFLNQENNFCKSKETKNEK